MKKFMLFLNAFFMISIINAGVSLDTVVETSEGPKQISVLKVGDKVICLDKNLVPNVKAIMTLQEVEVESFIEITTEDDVVMRVSHDQQVFVPYKWVKVDQLSLGDFLLKRDNTLIRVKGVCHKNEPATLRFITVEEHQNFLATKNGVLVHNGVGGASAGFWFGKFIVHFVAQAGIHIATAGVAIVCPPVAAPFYYAAQSTVAPVAEAASNVVAIGTAIAAGTVTGPV